MEVIPKKRNYRIWLKLLAFSDLKTMVFCFETCSELRKIELLEAEGREFGKKFEISRTIYSKGLLISKGLFGILNSPKKRTKKFDFTSMIPQVDLFSFVFWEKLKTSKIHFEIN